MHLVETNQSKLGDILTYFVPPPGSVVLRRPWTFELSIYHCDPTTGDQPCRASHRYLGRRRTDVPPVQGKLCARDGTVTAAGRHIRPGSCARYRMGSMVATFGDWPRLPRLPHRFASPTWICTTVVTEADGRWVEPPARERACSAVPS